jgi:hypothetical protein
LGLTQKILLFTSALVVALVGATLAFTTFQADRLAQQTLRQALAETSEVWDTFQADRYAKLSCAWGSASWATTPRSRPWWRTRTRPPSSTPSASGTWS